MNIFNQINQTFPALHMWRWDVLQKYIFCKYIFSRIYCSLIGKKKCFIGKTKVKDAYGRISFKVLIL